MLFKHKTSVSACLVFFKVRTANCCLVHLTVPWCVAVCSGYPPNHVTYFWVQLPAMWLQRCHRLPNNAHNEIWEEDREELFNEWEVWLGERADREKQIGHNPDDGMRQKVPKITEARHLGKWLWGVPKHKTSETEGQFVGQMGIFWGEMKTMVCVLSDRCQNVLSRHYLVWIHCLDTARGQDTGSRKIMNWLLLLWHFWEQTRIWFKILNDPEIHCVHNLSIFQEQVWCAMGRVGSVTGEKILSCATGAGRLK